MRLLLITISLIAILFVACTEEEGKKYVTDTPEPEDTIYYSRDILPILDSYCWDCHMMFGDGNFNTSEYDSLMLTGDHAPNVIPYQPGNSYLLHVIGPDDTTGHDDSPYPDFVIASFTNWIEQGALKN
jgi:hypothetical protein